MLACYIFKLSKDSKEFATKLQPDTITVFEESARDARDFIEEYESTIIKYDLHLRVGIGKGISFVQFDD